MLKKDPKVSVVLPVHNGGKFIKIAIDSVLSQSFTDFELIIVNDASDDNTLEILKSFNDIKIVLINVEKQISLSDVLNIGLKNAKGKYIARMDADDIMLVDRLLKQVTFLDENPEVVIVGGQVDLVDESGNIIGHRKYSLDDTGLRKNMFLYSPFTHPAVMYRRDVVLNVGGYKSGLKKIEDIDLWFKLSTKGKLANLPDTILNYRVTNSSESLSNLYEHFIITYNFRIEIIKNKRYPIDIRQRILLEVQRIIVIISRILPNKWFMKIFEFGRKVLNSF